MARGLAFLGIAVDPVHAGAGRTLGIVDLPVQRDALGYPLVYASSVKGALKSLCVRRSESCKVESDRGRIICEECKLCCCLFGPEPGEGDKGSGRLAFLDLIPLALPAPSAEYGFVYLTTPVLLSRALLELEAVGDRTSEIKILGELRDFLSKLYDESLELGESEVLAIGNFKDSVTIGSTPLLAKKPKNSITLSTELSKIFSRLGGLAKFLERRLVVASTSLGSTLIERSLIRVTRVALRRDRKTVAKGALWTEEYLPYGTIFLSGVIDTGFTNEYCKDIQGDPLSKLTSDVLNVKDDRFYVIIGGKETVGKGIIKFIVVRG